MRVDANSGIQGVTGTPATTSPAPKARLANDQASLASAQALHQAMEQTPAVRADKVALAKALLADPAYPSSTVIGEVAGVLAKSLKAKA